MSAQQPNVAIVGATGAVGSTMLAILESRRFPVGDLRLMASARSAGRRVSTHWGDVTIEDLATADPAGIDIALFSAGGEFTTVVLGAWLEDSFAIALAGIAGLASLIGVAELTGAFSTGLFTDRLGKRRAVSIGLVINAAGYAVMGLSGDSVVLGVGGALVAFLGFEFQQVLTLVRHRTRRHFVIVVPGNDLCERALAGAVRAHDGVHFAGFHR